MATIAVHVELVSNLSTPTFIAALKLFVARLVRHTDVYSDCESKSYPKSRQLGAISNDSNDFAPLTARHLLNVVSRPSDITHTASTFDSGSTSPTYFWHRWQKELHTEHSKTYPGEDNVVRVADIKLSNGKTLKRPVVRLCPLPL
ncbi:unnamed protein product [Macrosiphum euphorbiae]|uniref:DUF5641 domain-containing protein n=1 Tax=Macrosiphum euphorbiae TaxID=13131 RepID=A0AAV0XFC1_9HEMI|nr:unnamed protein product [Macrosiphum euphorbiae]